MKTIIKTVILASAAAVLCSCNALDIVQDNKLSASNMWKTSTQVESSTYGIYDRLRTSFVNDETNFFVRGELRVGQYMWTSSPWYNVWKERDVIFNTMTATTSATSWSALYSTIDQANAVIKYASDKSINMTDAKREWALGQGYFARAYCYFWAARLWGDVPLNLVPVESTTQPECYPSRAAKAEVYKQIGKDIETAQTYAENLGSDRYLASKDALNMLQADYALWMYSTQNGGNSYLTLAQNALSAMNLSSSSIESDYGDIFDRMKDVTKPSKNSKEVVFALYNNQSESKTGCWSWWFSFPEGDVQSAYRKQIPIKETQWLNYGTEYLAMLRDSRDNKGDTRVKYNLGEGDYFQGSVGKHGYWCNKYTGDLSSGKAVKDCDIVYYRKGYAVMLLAELNYYQGNYANANNALNIIAKRAYGVDSYYKTATKEAVLDALVHEYFLEFPSEGQIWWALIRLDKIWDYNSYLAENKSKTNILLWPISKSAIDKNSNLTQTEGWY